MSREKDGFSVPPRRDKRGGSGRPAIRRNRGYYARGQGIRESEDVHNY
jgi:hypothetical protein